MRRTMNAEFGNLIAAASKTPDEFNNDVAPVQNALVKQALDEQKAEGDKQTKREILDALDRARQTRDSWITDIRAYRKQVDLRKASLDRLDRAEKHGTKTGDFRPLLFCLGVSVPGFDSAAWLK